MSWATPRSFFREKNLPIQPDPFIWLFEVQGPAPAGGPLIGVDGEDQVFRFTPNPSPVTFGTGVLGPLVWRPLQCSFGAIQSDTQGNINGIPLAVSNVLGEGMKVLAANDYLRDHVVLMHLVHSNHLGDPDDKRTIRTSVADASADWRSINLTLSVFNAVDFTVPTQIIGPTCRWRYRGSGCGFFGDPGNTLGDCAGTFPECEDRGTWEVANGRPQEHPKRFGGNPYE